MSDLSSIPGRQQSHLCLPHPRIVADEWTPGDTWARRVHLSSIPGSCSEAKHHSPSPVSRVVSSYLGPREGRAAVTRMSQARCVSERGATSRHNQQRDGCRRRGNAQLSTRLRPRPPALTFNLRQQVSTSEHSVGSRPITVKVGK